MALSIAIQAVIILGTFLLGRELSPAVTLFTCARYVPLILLLTAIPLTPAGGGQREMLFVYFFGLAGVATTAAVSISLLLFACLLAVTAAGGVLLLLERLARPVLAPPATASLE